MIEDLRRNRRERWRREASTGWREASAEPKLTEKEERIELTLKRETDFF